MGECLILTGFAYLLPQGLVSHQGPFFLQSRPQTDWGVRGGGGCHSCRQYQGFLQVDIQVPELDLLGLPASMTTPDSNGMLADPAAVTPPDLKDFIPKFGTEILEGHTACAEGQVLVTSSSTRVGSILWTMRPPHVHPGSIVYSQMWGKLIFLGVGKWEPNMTPLKHLSRVAQQQGDRGWRPILTLDSLQILFLRLPSVKLTWVS